MTDSIKIPTAILGFSTMSSWAEINYFRFRVAILLFPVVGRCRNSQSFGDTSFDVAVVGKLDFVTWFTTILILDLFCHISQHDLKISPVSKNSHVFDVMPNNFWYTDCRTDCCILYPLHIQENWKSHERTAPTPSAEQNSFTDSKTELGAFLPQAQYEG